jgi:hypothetical protein
MSGLVDKVDRKARKPWIAQELISKMKWKNVKNEEGSKKYGD